MERRFEVRCEEMLAQAVASPDLVKEFLPRLKVFAEPFAESLKGSAQREHLVECLCGLLSPLDRKTGEAIAYLHDQERQGMQKFIGHVEWDHQPLMATLARQVGQELGEADGVIVFDPSAFPKKGTQSVGVARQWCGRLGKVDNCQVGIYMAYVSRKEQALVNLRLYLPQEWTRDKARCFKAGVPAKAKFHTRHELALEMLDEVGSVLPHAWIAGDDEMGRPSHFREKLRSRHQHYVLAVPSNTTIRDLEAPPPEYGGTGRPPKNPFVSVKRWCAALPESAWTKIDVRDGEKGPLVIEAVPCRVQAKTDQRRSAAEELLFATREHLADGSIKYDYHLSNAPSDTPLEELSRVAKAAHRIEECFKRGKGETGLADYQVRNWYGWHHHQTLSLLAAWFLNQETRRGKNTDTRIDDPAITTTDWRSHHRAPEIPPTRSLGAPRHPMAATQRTGAALSPSQT
jgi:SRSO17 transposase